MALNIPIILALVSSMASSTAALFQSRAIHAFSPFFVGAISTCAATVVLFVWIQLRERKIPQADPKLFPWRNIIIFVLLRGIFAGILFNYSLLYTTGIKAIFFTKAEAYFVLLWAVFLDGTRIPFSHALLLALHFIGAFFLSTGGKFELETSSFGDLLILAAMLLTSLSYRFGKNLSTQIGSIHTNFYLQSLSALVFIPLGIFVGFPAYEAFSNLGAWGDLAAYIILYTLFGFSIWLIALKSLETWLVSALRASGPLFAAPLAFLFFDQSLLPLQIAGGLLALATSFALALDQRPHHKN